MIKILERYISKALMSATVLVGSVIVGVLFLLGLLGELKNIGEGDYGLTQAVCFVLLRMPNQLYQFSPLLILIGSIVGLSSLSSHRELSVMRASGFSIRQIILTVLLAALVMIFAISLGGEWLGPNWSAKAAIQKETAENAGQAVVTVEGVWLHMGNNFIHISEMVNKKLLRGVTRYQFDDKHHLLAAYYAKTLTADHERWWSNEVVKTSFYKDRTKSQSFKQLPWTLKFNTNVLNMTLVDPNEMSLPKLLQFVRYLRANRLQANEYLFDFWQRIFQPFAGLVMVFLAIPFVLGSTTRSTTLGWRVMMGILTGFIFFILNAFFGQLSVVYQIQPFFAAILPIIAFAMLGLWLTKKMIKN